MKKTLALLAVAAMMFTAGCGAQKAAEDAANTATEKVEQAADAAKDAAETAANAMVVTAEDAAAAMQKIKEGDKSGIALGGVVPGVKVDVVTEMYGQPIENDGTILAFENGLDAKVKDNTVEEISTSYAGIPTPAGIEVGMEATELNYADVYGTATAVEEKDGNTVYKYLSSDKKWAINFVTRDGRITSIVCGLNK